MEASTDSILVERHGARANLILNRPPANALDIDTSRLLHQHLANLAHDSSVRVIVIQSASAKIFCAGADVSTVQAHDVPLMDELGRTLKDTFLLMRRMSAIIVAAVQGHCLGGGLELALAADFRLTAEDSGKWGLPEINLGLFPGGGAVAMLSRLVGPQKAFYLALSGQPVTERKAYEWGLADELIEREQFQTRVDEFAAMIAQAPQEPVKDIKAAVWQGAEMSLEGAFDFERVMHRSLVVTPDCYEGVDAFKERRPAQFGKVSEIK